MKKTSDKNLLVLIGNEENLNSFSAISLPNSCKKEIGRAHV